MALIGSFKFSPALWAYPHIRFLRKSRFSSLSVPAVFLLQLPVYQRNIYIPGKQDFPHSPGFPEIPIRRKNIDPLRIAAPILECREQEAAFRLTRLIIAAYRADRTDQEPVDLLRFPQAFLIVCFQRDVIAAMKKINGIAFPFRYLCPNSS